MKTPTRRWTKSWTGELNAGVTKREIFTVWLYIRAGFTVMNRGLGTKLCTYRYNDSR